MKWPRTIRVENSGGSPSHVPSRPAAPSSLADPDTRKVSCVAFAVVLRYMNLPPDGENGHGVRMDVLPPSRPLCERRNPSSVLLKLALSRTINFQYHAHPVLSYLSQSKPEPFPLFRD